jgi:hypothetical protein
MFGTDQLLALRREGAQIEVSEGKEESSPDAQLQRRAIGNERRVGEWGEVGEVGDAVSRKEW